MRLESLLEREDTVLGTGIDQLPYVDPNVEHVGVSHLRGLNAAKLRENEKTLVIRDKNAPVAVLLPYETFLDYQRELKSLMETVDLTFDPDELQVLADGLQAEADSDVKSIEDIRAEFKKNQGG